MLPRFVEDAFFSTDVYRLLCFVPNLQLNHYLFIYDSKNYIEQALALLSNITTLIMDLNIQLQFMKTTAAGSKAKAGVNNNARISKVIACLIVGMISRPQLI
jgi:hypothetical protein